MLEFVGHFTQFSTSGGLFDPHIHRSCPTGASPDGVAPVALGLPEVEKPPIFPFDSSIRASQSEHKSL